MPGELTYFGRCREIEGSCHEFLPLVKYPILEFLAINGGDGSFLKFRIKLAGIDIKVLIWIIKRWLQEH